MSVYKRLEELGVELGAMTAPAASYAPFVKHGNLLYLSGHLARRAGQIWKGRLGDDISTEVGQQAARAVAVDLVSTMHATIEDLDRVKKIVKLTAMVASAADFESQHIVANGASDFFAAVFQGIGPHARSAFGVARLPLGSCVEIELIVGFE
ncbi:RidA family protein [Pararhizobium qamdonense]|uniref:RidA family protein n=1 Tax=Pararhizobium qamdonense TaxID=3031126 RepID=UPI0023E0E0DA|nr:RidA family protein [Pararhizobium qamdonense]